MYRRYMSFKTNVPSRYMHMCVYILYMYQEINFECWLLRLLCYAYFYYCIPSSLHVLFLRPVFSQNTRGVCADTASHALSWRLFIIKFCHQESVRCMKQKCRQYLFVNSFWSSAQCHPNLIQLIFRTAVSFLLKSLLGFFHARRDKLNELIMIKATLLSLT